MEVKILHSILYKSLMPWVMDTNNTKAKAEKIKKIGSKESTSENELIQQLKGLLADYPELVEWLDKQNKKGIDPLKHHCYSIDFPAYSNTVSKYYNSIINLETLRVYNAFNAKMQKTSNNIDIVYHTTNALRNIKALTIKTVKEIKERGFEEEPIDESPLSHFVLQILRQHLTVLFFDIQDLSIASIDNPTSIEDFYLLDLNLSKNLSKEIKKISKKLDIENESSSNKTILKKSISPQIPKLSFGWKNGKVDQLHSLFNDLCIDINFLDEQKTSVDTLVELLINKEIVPGALNIYLACKTTEFVFVIDNLQNLFFSLKDINIENSLSFWSRGMHKKNPTLLKSFNLSKTRSKSKMNQEDKNEILEIISKHFL